MAPESLYALFPPPHPLKCPLNAGGDWKNNSFESYSIIYFFCPYVSVQNVFLNSSSPSFSHFLATRENACCCYLDHNRYTRCLQKKLSIFTKKVISLLSGCLGNIVFFTVCSLQHLSRRLLAVIRSENGRRRRQQGWCKNVQRLYFPGTWLYKEYKSVELPIC